MRPRSASVARGADAPRPATREPYTQATSRTSAERPAGRLGSQARSSKLRGRSSKAGPRPGRGAGSYGHSATPPHAASRLHRHSQLEPGGGHLRPPRLARLASPTPASRSSSSTTAPSLATWTGSRGLFPAPRHPQPDEPRVHGRQQSRDAGRAWRVRPAPQQRHRGRAGLPGAARRGDGGRPGASARPRPKIRYFHEPERIQYAGGTAVDPLRGQARWIGSGEIDHGQHDVSGPTEMGHGAALLIRRRVLEEVGLLGEDFFIYYEELDFGTRLRRGGLERPLRRRVRRSGTRSR